MKCARDNAWPSLGLSDLCIWRSHAVVLACQRELGLDRNKLDVNGGVIAIGHALTAAGVRLAITDREN